MQNHRPRTESIIAWNTVLILALVLGCVAFVRIRLADMPLERDEGEYGYAGQLIRQGIPPYKLSYNMKLPGTYFMYAGLMSLFGETPKGIRFGLLLVNAATIVLVYLLGRKLFNSASGLVGAAAYALLSLSHAFFGMSAHATHFVVLFAVAGLLALFYARETLKLWPVVVSGLLLGLAFLMKQQGIVFAVFGGGTLLLSRSRDGQSWRQRGQAMLIFSAAALMPFAAMVLLLLATGVFSQFWFWTFDYARQYVSLVPADLAPQLFLRTFLSILHWTGVLWLLAAAGLIALLMVKQTRTIGIWLALLTVASAVGVSAGFYFRPHYFILVLPALALLIAGLTYVISNLCAHVSFAKPLVYGVCLVVAAQFLIVHREQFFRMKPMEMTRSLYNGNGFVEIPSIAAYIRQHSAPGDRVAVLGSEPEVYFLSHRRSATGHIYMYGLMEPQPYALQMQQELIREVETNKPEFIVMANLQFSWLRRPNSHREVFDWLSGYTSKYYYPTALIEYDETGKVEESWDAAANRQPRQADFIVAFRRIPSQEANGK